MYFKVVPICYFILYADRNTFFENRSDWTKMKKITVPVLNLILAFGLVCILAGAFLFSVFASEICTPVSPTSVFVMILGAAIFYFSMVFLHWASFFFAGMSLFFMGLTSMLISAKFFPYGIDVLWPVDLCWCGICLILTCVFKHKKVRGVYLFPSSLLLFLGCFFLLFSLRVIKISFMQFMSRCFPFILILFGGFLVAVFFYQKKDTEHFPFDKDELADSTDDEDPFSGVNE